MKTILVLSLLAALSAFVLFATLSFELCIPTLFAAGLVAMFVADYAHVWRPSSADIATEVSRRSERFRLAA